MDIFNLRVGGKKKKIVRVAAPLREMKRFTSAEYAGEGLVLLTKRGET